MLKEDKKNTNRRDRQDRQDRQDRHKGDANRDPISGTPGSHPVGTGVGAAGGAVTGGALGAIGGPVGAAVGAVAGAVAGGLAGKSIAENIDPTVEDAYWKNNYAKQKYVERDTPYNQYQPAYRTGYEGRGRYPGKKFEDVEDNLHRDYDRAKGNSSLTWDKAKNATRDAWNRVERYLPGDSDGDGR